MLPAAATKALQLTRDPDCSVAEFASVVERDIKLATEVLAMANTPMFGVGQPVVSLSQATVRLGLRQCRNLILTTSAASLIKKLPLEAAWVREVICKHSFATASSCSHLNRLLNLGFQGEEFTAGLLHDFGRILLAMVDSKKFEQADSLDFEESSAVLDRERAVFSTDHCELGAWFARNSGIPAELLTPILYHHRLELGLELDRLTLLTAAGDHIANHIQRVEEKVGYQPAENTALAILEQKLDRDLLATFETAAPSLLDCVISDVNRSAIARP